MMGFDPATSSFLALLENKPYRKLKKAKSKTKIFEIAAKNVQNIFLTQKFCQVSKN